MTTTLKSVSPVAAAILLVFIAVGTSLVLMVFFNQVLPAETEQGEASKVAGTLKVDVASSSTWWMAQLNISNPHTSPLIDYSVRIELNSLNYPLWNRSSAEHIYFALDPNGVNPLYYWIEKYDPENQEAVIWVRIPSLPPNTNTIIYMFVDDDNPRRDHNNPHRTFLFFDHFEGNSLNTSFWDPSTSTDYEVRDSMLITRRGGIVMQNPFPFIFQNGYAAETRVMYVVDKIYYSGGLVIASNVTPKGSNNAQDALVMIIRGNPFVYTMIGYGADGSVNSSYNVIRYVPMADTIDYTWYTIGVGANSTAAAIWLYESNYFFSNVSSWAKDMRWLSLGNFYASYPNGVDVNIQDTYYDWVRVRKWAYPEPQVFFGEWVRNTTSTVFLRNVGSSSVVVDQAYLRLPGSDTIIASLPLGNLEVSPGQTIEIDLSFLGDYPGNQIEVVVAAQGGAIARVLISPD